MSDLVKGGLQFQQAGTPADPSKMPAAVTTDGATLEGGTGEHLTPLTRADVLQIVRDELPRLSQSVSDKTVARVQKMMQTLEKQGITATHEQVAAIVADAGDALTSNAEPSKPTPAQAQSNGVTEQAAPVVIYANDLVKRAGLNVETDFTDQEKQHLAEAPDEDTFIEWVKATIKDKADKRGSPSRVPGMSAGISAKPGSQEAMLAEAQALMKTPTAPGAVKRLREIQGLLK